jgi:putative SOS response-associated peptidase YedK
MCYDISFKSNIKTIEDYFPGIRTEPQLSFDFYDLDWVQAQANMRYGCIVNETNILSIEKMLWAGILNQKRERVYNARSETVTDKKSLWYRFRKNRGLVPVTGIFEHRDVPGIKNKIPYHIRIADREIFYLPCLYDDGNIPNPKTGDIPRTFTLLTRKANSVMQEIHNADPADPRMVLFLTPELEREWIKEDLPDDRMKEIFNYEISSNQLEFHTVFTIRTPKPRPDGKDKTEFYDWGPKVSPIKVS